MDPTDALASRGTRLVPAASDIRHRLSEHARTPLHRDGYALGFNSVFTAAAGLLYWIVAARSYSAHAVGLNSALISSMMFLAGIACLNFPNILVRFLPHSGGRTSRRVVAAYGIAAAVAVLAAVVFVAGVTAWAPQLGFLRSDRGLLAWFVFSTLAWCLFMIQDSVLTAVGRAVWVPVENAVFSLAKLALLAALATALSTYGIFVSWTVAMLFSVIGVNAVIFSRLMPRLSRSGAEPTLSMRDRAFARYFAGDYACSVAWLSATNLMPIVVAVAAGATANAYWALSYAVVLPIYAFAQNIGTSLMLHAGKDPAALPLLTRKAAHQGARVLVPVVALLVIAAPYLLSLFGQNYVHNSETVLRLLAFGALPNFIVALVASVARVQRRLRRAVIALTTEAVLSLSLATPLIHAVGVTGAAVAFVGSQCLVAAVLLATSNAWLASVHVEEHPVARERAR
jgi:O-antigen/teichoic acid export membrane protein